MKRFLLAIFMTLSAMTLVVAEAEAKRLGGGTSVGRQMPNYSKQAAPAQPAQAAKPAQPAPAATPAPSPWKGILGGALLGLGLGALMSHLGLGGALGSMIGSLLLVALLAMAAFFVYRLLRKNSQPAPAYAGPSYPSTPEIGSRLDQGYSQPAALHAPQAISGTIPADFDVAGFLRNAKTYFIRLQSAWDKADINDIREFTTPEMFAELRLQIQERGASSNFTDVVSVEAELAGLETVGDDYVAGVRFSGMIRESENAQAEPFTEIWNLTKPKAGGRGWLLAGIQQM
jgi:predicted lipid-binding transport protein (Tim44 family)